MSHGFRSRNPESASSLDCLAGPADPSTDAKASQELPGQTGMLHGSPGGGSARVIAASEINQTAEDGLFTPNFLKELKRDRNETMEQVADRVVRLFLPWAESDERSGEKRQFADVARVGGAADGHSSEKSAFFLANVNYQSAAVLPNARVDAEKTKATMESRGYRTLDLKVDQNAAAMASAYRGAVSKVQANEELFLYYAGHGLPAGLVGSDTTQSAALQAGGGAGHRSSRDVFTDASQPDPVKLDIMPNEVIADVVDQATSKGAHLTFVLDTCFSGGATDAVRRRHRNQLAKQSAGTDAGRFLDIADRCARLKADLIGGLLPGMSEQVMADGGITARAGTRAPGARGMAPAQDTPKRCWHKLLAPLLRSYIAALGPAGRALPPLPEEVPLPGQLVWIIDRISEAALRAAEEQIAKKADGPGSDNAGPP